MFEPKYLIRLNKNAFFSDQVVCLGSQLKSIFKNLNKLLGPHVWYCADIDAISSVPKRLGVDSFRLKKICNNSHLMNLCENIDQFLSGVFIAIKESEKNLKLQNLCAGTEDDQFRFLDLNGVLIEIRAFDTSYFELYSENIELIEILSKIYNVKIEMCAHG